MLIIIPSEVYNLVAREARVFPTRIAKASEKVHATILRGIFEFHEGHENVFASANGKQLK